MPPRPPEDIVPNVPRIGLIAPLAGGRLISLDVEPDRMENLTTPRPERWVSKRISHDGGRTWTAETRAFAFPPGLGVGLWPLAFADHAGRLHAFAMRYYGLGAGWDGGERRCPVFHTVSTDGGNTWAELKQVDFGHAYTGALNSIIETDAGRIIVPLSYLDDNRKDGLFVCMAVYSDDGGQTWGKSNDCPVGGGEQFIESGAMEPVVVQLPGGMVWMLLRTVTGCFWECFSNDGAIWTPPKPTRIVSSNAPGGLVKLADGRIALFWNNLYGEPFDSGVSYARHKLSGAISSDAGQTWSKPKVVAQVRATDLPKAQTTYPFPYAMPDGSILLLYHRTHAYAGRDWWDPPHELVRVDPDWLAA